MSHMETQAPNNSNYVHIHNSRSDEEKAAKEREIDSWLPITSNRNAKWWYSAFHNVTAMVGAGVLSLPYAMAQLGWGPGIVVLVLSWVITLYTLWLMVEMHEVVPGKRFDRYHELGQHAFGKKLGLWIIVPQQLIVEVGIDIVYMVTGGQSLQQFYRLVTKKNHIRQTYFIMIFASVHFVISHLPDLNSIAGVSLVAAVMSISYSTIAWGATLKEDVQPNVKYDYKSKSTAGTAFNFFTALGDVAFACAGHNVVLEIQATIPSTPEKPSKKPMWKGVVVGYIIVALCYFPVAIIGYWKFGNQLDGSILEHLDKPTWLIAMANIFVVIHVIGGYQVTSCGYWEWQDKQQLPPRAVTVILELKGKLDVMKVERNKLKRIVDGMEEGERENLRKKVEEMDFVNLQEAAKTSILEEKIEEMEIILAQETGKAMILEKKITKLKTIIFVSCFLFIGFVVGIMK